MSPIRTFITGFSRAMQYTIVSHQFTQNCTDRSLSPTSNNIIHMPTIAHVPWVAARATIAPEPKIRTPEQNLIYYTKRKQFFLFARLTSDQMFAYYVQEPCASAMSYSRLPSFNHHGKCFFGCLFLESVKC